MGAGTARYADTNNHHLTFKTPGWTNQDQGSREGYVLLSDIFIFQWLCIPVVGKTYIWYRYCVSDTSWGLLIEWNSMFNCLCCQMQWVTFYSVRPRGTAFRSVNPEERWYKYSVRALPWFLNVNKGKVEWFIGCNVLLLQLAKTEDGINGTFAIVAMVESLTLAIIKCSGWQDTLWVHHLAIQIWHWVA